MTRRILTTLLLMMTSICAVGAFRRAAATTVLQAGSASERQLSRGSRVIVRNRNGRITITGWDRDTVQATARSNNRSESAPVSITEDGSQAKTLLIAPDARGRGDIHLEVRLPRYAVIESVSAGSGDVEVTGIDGSVDVSSGSGDVRINRVGPLEVSSGSGDLEVGNVSGVARIQTGSGSFTASNIKGDLFAKVSSGDVSVDSVGGLVDVAVSSGNLTLRNLNGDARLVSISGDVDVQCVRGRVEAKTTSGSITLVGVTSDVDASTTSGDVRFTGTMRAGGRYNLKSLSGNVQLSVQPEPPGFTAMLSSYGGEIETDFPLRIESGPILGKGRNRRLTGRYQDGTAQVTLDSFSGAVRLNKSASKAATNCTGGSRR